MKGLRLLAIRNLAYHKGKHFLLILCIGLAIYLPAATQALVTSYGAQLETRGNTTPLLLGARGSRFDLTLSTLYFRPTELDSFPWSETDELQNDPHLALIPIHRRHTSRDYPLLGTTPEFYELYGLSSIEGDIPLLLGDALLGANVAEALELKVGDSLFSDPEELYDIAKPPALKMRVAGILKETGGPEDEAVFVDIKTAWVLDGLAHGHDDTNKIDPKLILGEAEQSRVVSQALMEYREVTPDNLASFHSHLHPGSRPLHAAIVMPAIGSTEDTWNKAATLAKARLNRSRVLQLIEPKAVVHDLLQFVFKLKAFFDTYSGVLIFITGLLTALVLTLSARLRAKEMATLHRMGCSRRATWILHLYSTGFILLASCIFAFVGVLGTLHFLPNWIQSL